MSNRKALAVVLLCVALLGLAVGLWPHSLPAAFGDGQPCGSAFMPDTRDAYVSDLAAEMRGEVSTDVAACDAELSSARTLALVLVGGAALGGLGVALTRQRVVSGS